MSTATNLAGLAGRRSEVYVRDVVAHRTILVSRGDGTGGAPAIEADTPSISADGSRVAFVAKAGDWGLGAPGDQLQVYVRNITAGTTTLVSRDDGPDGVVADDVSGEPDLSADGMHVSFVSAANNLRPTGAANDEYVYVRDLASGRTEMIAPTGKSELAEASISGDGQRVVFVSSVALVPADQEPARGVELDPQDVYVRDRGRGNYILVSRGSGANGRPGVAISQTPAISEDGLHVAFETNDNFLAPQFGIVVRDLSNEKLAELGAEGNPSGDAGGPAALSANGRYIAFSSQSQHLTGADLPNYADVLVLDMKTGLIVDAARGSGSAGVPADAPSGWPAISADGSAIAFQTYASNLSDSDSERFFDIFLRRPAYGEEGPPPKCGKRLATQIGTPRDDRMIGTNRKDTIVGLGGDDRIETLDSADVICAGAGDDIVDAGSLDPETDFEGRSFEIVRGEAGNDRLLGGTDGPSLLIGGRGNDFLRGTPRRDRIFGGSGRDHLSGDGRDLLNGGPGRDSPEP